MKKTKKTIPKKDYSSESIDITRKCCSYLVENNFYQNQEQDNIELIEKALISYSTAKVVEWKIDLNKVKIEAFGDLSNLLNILNDHISTEKERDAFFAQYTHCIIFLYSKIKNRKPIKWTKVEKSTLPMAYTYITEENELVEFITTEVTIPYEIPLKLLEKIKSYYPEKKNPTLQK